MTTLKRDSDTINRKKLQLTNICLPPPSPMYTVDDNPSRNNFMLKFQNECDADTENIDQQFIHVSKKHKPRKMIKLYPRKKYIA